MRAGELWGLRWKDVLWQESLIRVEQTCDKNDRSLKIGTKGRKMRYVPLTSESFKVLDDHKSEIKHSNCELVFHTYGRPLGHRNFLRDFWGKDMKIVERELGLRAIRFHDLRHTSATLMLHQGIEPSEVQQILGHSSILVTMRYVHLLGNKSAQKAAKHFGTGMLKRLSG